MRRPVVEDLPEEFVPRRPSRSYPEPAVAPPELNFFNGLGRFSLDGREYVTVLDDAQWTTAP